MKWGILASLLLALAMFLPGRAAPIHAGDAPLASEGPLASEAQDTFRAFDLFVDSGSKHLAAYQLEFKSANGSIQIVGIEGGDSWAFQAAPFYDPAAMQGDRVVIGAFATQREPMLPTGKTRVARVHVMIPAGAAPNLRAELQTAGSPDGSKIDATASWSPVPEAQNPDQIPDQVPAQHPLEHMKSEPDPKGGA